MLTKPKPATLRIKEKSLTKLRLNLGCGSVRPDGWINTDSSLNATLQKIPFAGKLITSRFNKVVYDNNNMIYMNLNRPWKYLSGSVDLIYASHVFEHLSQKSAELFLKESFRCLKHGGVIRLVVPDLYKICRKYLEEYELNGNSDTTEFIMWAINMHKEGQYGKKIGPFKKMIFEWQDYPHQHKYMYDEKSLRKKLDSTGFREFESLEYGVSKYIPEIKEVEGSGESYLSVYLEAKKP